MADGQWKQAKELFLAALDRPAGDRDRFLREECGDNTALFDEVISLLSSHDDAEGFIERLAFSVHEVFFEGSALIGKTIGNYRIVSEIGLGGMGSVFLAERGDGEFRQQVAVKLVRPGLDTADMRRRFLHERQILADLEHPYIARLIGGGTTDDGLPYLIMEYVQGQPITVFARELELNQRLTLFQKVCEAVASAHRNLVIHRDLKPSNIFVTADGQPKLLDFGIAKLLDASGADIQTLTNVGAFTPDYASPEQIKGAAITTASDIYSLGVVLYELLTGRSPYRFETRSPDELIRVICNESPSSPSRSLEGGEADRFVRPSDLTGDLENIVLLALRKEPERRYSSVEQFSADIQRHLDGLPVIAREDTLGYRASKFITRHRYRLALAAALVLVLIAGIVATAWQASVARQQRDAAEAERAKAESINRFLQEMLSFSNQSWSSAAGRNRDVTINEMLDEIAPRLETELADQPDVRARMYRTIAGAYHSQGRFKLAEKYLRDALAIQLGLFGDSHPETLTTQGDLGVALFQVGNLDEAQETFASIAEKLRQQQGPQPTKDDRLKLAGALHGLGSVLTVKSQPDAAIPYMREARATLSGLDLTVSERGLLAEIMLNLGAAILAKGDLVESESLLRESLAVFRSLPGNPRWEMGVTLSKLGECLIEKGSYDEAASLLQEGETVYLNTIGEANNYLTRNLNSQALAAMKRGDTESAESLSQRARAMLDRSGSPPGPIRARTYLTLGTLLCKSGRRGEGRGLLSQSADIFRKTADPGSTEAVAALQECPK
jgi:eukaryotic-like serine/threonine-protein kinase